MKEMQIKIYENSPLFIQNSLVTFEGIRRLNKRYSKTYATFKHELEMRDYSDLQEEIRFQEKEMQKLIRHAVSNSPFYRKFYEGIDIEEIKTVDDLKKLPLLCKETVRKNIDAMYTVDENSAIVSLTSGTSGKAMKFLYTVADMQKRMAHLDFFKKQHGFINLKMKRASFSDQRFIPKRRGEGVYWRNNIFNKQRLYSAVYCQPAYAESIAKNLNEFKPLSLDGMPSAIYEIAKWINDHNIKLTFKPVAIFTTAENLYPYYRKEIEKAFGCKVRDQYASSEGAPFIAECTEGKLHYNLTTGVIEVAEDGEIFVTCFNTYGTPLIRYAIGDSIEFAKEQESCTCGSVHPVVQKVHGRTNDYLQSKNKEKFTALHLSLINEQLAGVVKNMQFKQNKMGFITVLVEADEQYTASIGEIIEDEIEYLLGEEIEMDIQVVDKIPRGSNNKFRMIINELV